MRDSNHAASARAPAGSVVPEPIRVLVGRGGAAGGVAGLAAFLVAWLVGEGPLQAGIAYESAHEPPGQGGSELVSRTIQATIGLGAAAVLVGLALGLVFGLLYRPMWRRLGELPPGTSEPATIDERTMLWLAMLAISILVTVAVVAAPELARRWFGAENAVLGAVAVGGAVVIIAWSLLPRVDETPADFAASQLWQYRLAAVSVQLTLWATLGIVFGLFASRAAARPGRRTLGLSLSRSGGRDARSG